MKGQNSSTEMIMKGQNPEHRVSQMLRTAGRRSWGEPENSQSVCWHLNPGPSNMKQQSVLILLK